MTPEEFRALHDEMGITISDLARALGIYRRSIQRWRSGQSNPPPYIHLAMERLAQILDEESIP